MLAVVWHLVLQNNTEHLATLESQLALTKSMCIVLTQSNLFSRRTAGLSEMTPVCKNMSLHYEVLYLTATLHFPDRKTSQHLVLSASTEKKNLTDSDAAG